MKDLGRNFWKRGWLRRANTQIASSSLRSTRLGSLRATFRMTGLRGAPTRTNSASYWLPGLGQILVEAGTSAGLAWVDLGSRRCVVQVDHKGAEALWVGVGYGGEGEDESHEDRGPGKLVLWGDGQVSHIGMGGCT